MFGGVPTIFHYFQPDGGPWVYAWYATVVLLWIFGGVWLFLKGGAEQLIEYRAPFRLKTDDPGTIKLFFVIGVVAGAVALTLMLLGYVTLP